MFGRHRRGGEDDGAHRESNNQVTSIEEGRRKKRRIGRKKKKLDNIPARRPLHKIFVMIAFLTALCALGMAAGQIMGIIVFENTIVTYVLRAYVVLLSLLVVFIEMEWPAQIRDSFLFRHWFTRGLFYAFIGVVGMQENESTDIVLKKESEAYDTVGDISIVLAWNMVGCGLLYSLMGVLCFHYLLKKYRQNYQERLEHAREDQDGEGSNGQDEEDGVNEVEQDIALNAAQSAFANDIPSKADWTEETEKTSYNGEENGEKENNVDEAGTEEPSWIENNNISDTENSSSAADAQESYWSEVSYGEDEENAVADANDQQPTKDDDDDDDEPSTEKSTKAEQIKVKEESMDVESVRVSDAASSFDAKDDSSQPSWTKDKDDEASMGKSSKAELANASDVSSPPELEEMASF